MIYKNYIFDLDDTLVYCGKYYTQAKVDFAEYKSKSTGLPVDFCQNMVADIDVKCTVLPGAFKSGRLPTAFHASSIALDIISKRVINYKDAEKMRTLAMGVFEAEYETIPGAVETLEEIKKSGREVFVITKGEEKVQLRKLLKSGIYDIVGSDNLHINEVKTPEILAQFVSEKGISIQESILVGDSVRDDIRSAHVIGMDSILVYKQMEESWKNYENVEFLPTYKVDRVSEILAHL